MSTPRFPFRQPSAGSPNAKRDPSTPVRVVRNTRTPPTTRMASLPDDDLIIRGSASQLHVDVSSSSEEEIEDSTVTAQATANAGRPPRAASPSSSSSSSAAQDSDRYKSDSFEDYYSDEEWCATPPDNAVVHPAAARALDEDADIRRTLPPGGSVLRVIPSAPGSLHSNRRSSGPVTPKEGGDFRVVKARPPPLEVDRLDKIGRGSFGDVYKARVKETGKIIAVKEIVIARDSRCRDTSKQLQELEREIRVMQKLNHPNIVKYLGSKRNEDGLSIFMEFADGGTIGNELRECGKMSEGVVKGYMQQLLAGLEYLHRRNIVHRDLKGDNLFLMGTKELRVGDFGTSKELQTVKFSNTVAGTPNFMAPEMIECVGHSIEADIWSVGCCAIQMITGKPPFSNLDNQMAVMFAVLKGQILKQLPEDVSDELKDFLKVCTYKNPKDRWPCKMLREHSWLKEGGASSETAVAPPPPSKRPPKS